MRAVFLTALLLMLATGSVQAQQISVNGEAMVRVEPDEILVTFGIETLDNDILVSKQVNNEILKKALMAIQECGVPEKDIQTDHLSIQPGYSGDHIPKNFLGYFVRNTLVVTLDRTDEVEELVTRTLETGVNYLHGIEFRTTELKKYREQARELALQAAQEKAEKMAAVLGQSVGSPVQISEGWSPSMYPSSWSGWGYGRGRGMSQNVIQNAEGGSGEIADTIALGKISIQASVRVSFELEEFRRK
jgi:uncharacterized protein YggE